MANEDNSAACLFCGKPLGLGVRRTVGYCSDEHRRRHRLQLSGVSESAAAGTVGANEASVPAPDPAAGPPTAPATTFFLTFPAGQVAESAGNAASELPIHAEPHLLLPDLLGGVRFVPHTLLEMMKPGSGEAGSAPPVPAVFKPAAPPPARPQPDESIPASAKAVVRNLESLVQGPGTAQPSVACCLLASGCVEIALPAMPDVKLEDPRFQGAAAIPLGLARRPSERPHWKEYDKWRPFAMQPLGHRLCSRVRRRSRLRPPVALKCDVADFPSAPLILPLPGLCRPQHA